MREQLNLNKVDPFFCYRCRCDLHDISPCYEKHKCKGIKTGDSCFRWIDAWKKITDKCAGESCTGYGVPVRDPNNPEKYVLSKYCPVHTRRQQRAVDADAETPKDVPHAKSRKTKVAYFTDTFTSSDANKVIADHEEQGYYLECVVPGSAKYELAIFRKRE